MVTIVDYGSGNLRSVQKAFERFQVQACITDDPQVVSEAKRLVLPGVGAFGDAMRELEVRGLVEPIVRHLQADRPFFGICMGMQLLFETGWEGGRQQGLGVLQGEVLRFDLPVGMKIPHMGWNTVTWRADSRWQATVGDGHYFYFVHSYFPQPHDEAVIAAQTDYGGAFCSAVSRGRLFATQFHPEKSQAVGMRLIESFLNDTD
ncbi:MAG: imidazole glycerol phosphate synthase subunit HisH [Planctomycetia bacterium]|nr:imidazole glycerol phosphate synthase subunit HisH [Planctomycetia bacterium]RLT12962.1 MAG: imidazole glycerol phosphate synthase subunit HisH [Planctomycetota bacterium]